MMTQDTSTRPKQQDLQQANQNPDPDLAEQIRIAVRNEVKDAVTAVSDAFGEAMLAAVKGQRGAIKGLGRRVEDELRALGLDVLDTLLKKVADSLLGPIKTRLETVLDDILGSATAGADTGSRGLLGSLVGGVADVVSGAFGGFFGGGSTAAPVSKPIPATPGVGGAFVPVLLRAEGGPLVPGMPTLVGEKGPELLIPRLPGEVLPNHLLRAGQGRPSVTNTYHIDARGAAPGVERRILQALKESEERAVNRALNAVVRSGQRGGAFARLPRV